MKRTTQSEFFTSLLVRYADSLGRITNPYGIANRYRAIALPTDIPDITTALSPAVRTERP